MIKKNFYLTTAIPYVNGKPHLGHVLEWLQADALARYQLLLNKNVIFSSGADENSLKNVQAAQAAGVAVQDWLDEYSTIFENAYQFFNISLTTFRRGSDQKKHWPGVQKLFQIATFKGDIYKKEYQGLYCVGCESFYKENELVDGKCKEHLTLPEFIKEENYFFRLSKYQNQLHDLIKTDQLRIVSKHYKNEMLAFIEQGLEDFSISRSKKRARGVGVPVPNDPSQVIYVWFDALTIYMTAIGWGYDQANWQKYWPVDVHFIGKGINRFHSIYWPAMLLSAQLPLPKTISVHGYITANNQKMSKSLGNVIDPFTLVKQYGLEPVRYYLLKEIPTHSDGDFSLDRFKELYDADLANGLGNLCSRVATMAAKEQIIGHSFVNTFNNQYIKFFEKIELSQAFSWIFEQITITDQFLSQSKPWTKKRQEKTDLLLKAIDQIQSIAFHLQPFMPTTAVKIIKHFSHKIKPLEPLFPRLS